MKKNELIKAFQNEGYLESDHPMKLIIEYQGGVIVSAKIGETTCDLYKVENSDYDNVGIGLSHVYAIGADVIKKAWRDSGQDLELLGAFVREFPAAFYFGWVRAIINKITAQKHAFNDPEPMARFERRKRGDRKTSVFQNILTNFAIHEEINKLILQGYTTASSKMRESAFAALAERKLRFPNGETSGPSRIRDLYYWFAKSHYGGTPVFFDQEQSKIISGPQLVEVRRKDGDVTKMIAISIGK